MITTWHQSNARALGVQVRTQGYRANTNRPANDIRADCIERLYGKGWGLVIAKSPISLDQRITFGIRARSGDYGRHVQASQNALRIGRDALTEYQRITRLKRRRPTEEATLLATVRAEFAKATKAMDQHTAATH